jgi:hypothetical protein
MNSNRNEQLLRRMRTENIRRTDLAQTAADVTVCSVRIKINNAGEARADFMFPCRYSQLPTINFGFEVQSTVTSGRMPVFAGSVDKWYSEGPIDGSQLYTGAKLLISSESSENISFVCVATASGIAFSGPTRGNYND